MGHTILGRPCPFWSAGHQGIGNRLIEGVPKPTSGPVVRQVPLGGILSHYYREAAWSRRSSFGTGRGRL